MFFFFLNSVYYQKDNNEYPLLYNLKAPAYRVKKEERKKK